MPYAAQVRSTDTFGRMLCTARQQHFVSDGPASLGCPEEAVMPGELFLAGIAACGVELVEVFAREEGLPLRAARCDIEGEIGPGETGMTLFESVRLEFVLEGVTEEQGTHLVERFEGR
jgi:uncharacterized OsmC-like protein